MLWKTYIYQIRTEYFGTEPLTKESGSFGLEGILEEERKKYVREIHTREIQANPGKPVLTISKSKRWVFGWYTDTLTTKVFEENA